MSFEATETTSAADGWQPARVRLIVSRFAAPCFWCGEQVPADTEIAYYPDERATSHTACHTEACG